MGESKLNINSEFKATMRTANAIFRGGCVNTCRALFTDRRLYVNWQSALLSRVCCPTQAEGAYCFLFPAGKKARERERTGIVFPLPPVCLSMYTLTLQSPFSLTITP